ncbi:hypothetical protein EXU57_22750 [Segetibacter sp. 3557_3]|uniref:hypothetical protein n=1 Tax=Segetibacter sp. 3557_3 TaxID=2547429 RepID=UPI001058CE4D|nr:hypothetical protein [Segetibacter sp. 3557_3]TDH19725.1 hypothetical protein EXU57_22750 [Segetibacter sp. 3557_3]
MEKDNEKNSQTGNDQSSFAGTNPNRYGDPLPADDQDNPIQDNEAQNVTDGAERLSGKEAEDARKKAMEGINRGKAD